MNRIKNHREKKGITQQALAKELGINTSTVAKWETHASTPRAKVLIQLAEIFNCTVDELLRGEST